MIVWLLSFFVFITSLFFAYSLPYYVSTISGNSTELELRNPAGIWVDSLGTLYVADTGNNIVRKFSSVSSEIFAGSRERGYSGNIDLYFTFRY